MRFNETYSHHFKANGPRHARVYLPRKTRDEAHVLAALRARHAARAKDIKRRKRIATKLTK